MTESVTRAALYQRAKRAQRASDPPLLPLAELIERRPDLGELSTVGALSIAAAMEGA